MSLTSVKFGKGDLPGFVAGPKTGPAVIVLQEWWGITDEIKRQATYLQQQTDFQVFIPDLYHGKIGVDAEEASHMMNNLDWPRAVDEIKEAVKYVKEQGASQVGAVGFCMGGALACLAAEHAGAAAAVPFYGTPDPALGHPDKVKAPLQFHVGKEDAFKGFADPETVNNWAKKNTEAGGTATVYEYEKEGHGFMNAGKDIHEMMKTGDLPIGSKASQDLAWSRAVKFLKQNLT
ncbi:hypothetical protein WJX74_000860 [Apatococcus lobatus]|uniref:Dienelactone hydrolase domain-containing protein n=1 Tax=Apatococcus lobatus TaxID=904363 RepID=A0AAW1R255_9CHLO